MSEISTERFDFDRHYDAVLDLLRDTDVYDPDRHNPERMWESGQIPGAGFVAEKHEDGADEVVGCIFLDVKGDFRTIAHGLAVSSDARRQRIASRLLDKAEEVAVRSGSPHIEAFTNSNNEAARAFFLSRGYHVEGTMTDYLKWLPVSKELSPHFTAFTQVAQACSIAPSHQVPFEVSDMHGVFQDLHDESMQIYTQIGLRTYDGKKGWFWHTPPYKAIGRNRALAWGQFSTINDRDNRVKMLRLVTIKNYGKLNFERQGWHLEPGALQSPEGVYALYDPVGGLRPFEVTKENDGEHGDVYLPAFFSHTDAVRAEAIMQELEIAATFLSERDKLTERHELSGFAGVRFRNWLDEQGPYGLERTHPGTPTDSEISNSEHRLSRLLRTIRLLRNDQ